MAVFLETLYGSQCNALELARFGTRAAGTHDSEASDWAILARPRLLTRVSVGDAPNHTQRLEAPELNT